MLIRVAFILFASAAVASTSYVAYQGKGGESSDLDRSMRVGSAGAGRLSGRVK